MKDPVIAQATQDDLDQLHRISIETFYETFAGVNTKEDMDQYLSGNLSREALSEELNDPLSVFYFATIEGEVAGYFKIRFGSDPVVGTIGEGQAAELQRIYVLAKFQGRNIGKIMLDFVIDLCRDRDMSWLWLGVWEENVKAIRFYERNGFAVFGSHIFRLGNDDQTDLLMKIRL